MSTIPSRLICGVGLKSVNTISAVISYKRIAMDASNLKPRKYVILVSILHRGYIMKQIHRREINVKGCADEMEGTYSKLERRVKKNDHSERMC